MNYDYVILVIKNLTARRLRSWLTMIGIFIGIAAVVALIGLGEGLRNAITSQFGFLGTDVLSVQASGINFAGPPGTGTPHPLSDTLVKKIDKIPGIDIAFNRYIDSVTLEFNDRQTINMAISVPEGSVRKTFEQMVNLKVSEGRLLKEGDVKRVLLGHDFTKEDTYGQPIHVNDKILLNGKSFEVVGIVEKKGSFIIDSSIFVNENIQLQDLRVDDGTTNIIAVKVKDEKKIGQVQSDIEKLLRKERNVKEGEEDFIVETPQKALESLDSTLFAIQLFVTIIALISLVVGGIGIMNTMYTSVLERTKEIGIMKSIGAKNSTIFTLFFIESGLLGFVGGLIGVILGMSLAYGFAFLGKVILGSDLIQAKVSLFLILGSLAFSFILGTIFGVLPAYQASKLRPVESLRSAS